MMWRKLRKLRKVTRSDKKWHVNLGEEHALIRAEVSFPASSSWRDVEDIEDFAVSRRIFRYFFAKKNPNPIEKRVFFLKSSFVSKTNFLGDFGFLQRWLHGSDVCRLVSCHTRCFRCVVCCRKLGNLWKSRKLLKFTKSKDWNIR